MKNYICIAILLIATGTGVMAQPSTIRRVLPQKQSVSFAESWRPPGSGQTRIIGTVIDIRMVPVARVKVQLRNLVNGTVQQATESDDTGEYEFDIDSPSTYVVEMVMVDGYVVALSNAGSLARYETMRTVVQLPGRWDSERRNMTIPQNGSDFLGRTASSSMTSTTMTMAVTQNITPLNSGEPVSPASPTR